MGGMTRGLAWEDDPSGRLEEGRRSEVIHLWSRTQENRKVCLGNGTVLYVGVADEFTLSVCVTMNVVCRSCEENTRHTTCWNLMVK